MEAISLKPDEHQPLYLQCTGEHLSRLSFLWATEAPLDAHSHRDVLCRPLTYEQTLQVAHDVAEALAYLHARGIIHR